MQTLHWLKGCGWTKCGFASGRLGNRDTSAWVLLGLIGLTWSGSHWQQQETQDAVVEGCDDSWDASAVSSQ